MSEEYFVKAGGITRPPVHPGVFFAEAILPAFGRRTIGEIATLLGVSRQTLQVMAGETAVSPDMAVRLGKFCGNGPGLWLRMQAAYDVWEASKRLKARDRKDSGLTIEPPASDETLAVRVVPQFRLEPLPGPRPALSPSCVPG